jgi:hypothetical protein
MSNLIDKVTGLYDKVVTLDVSSKPIDKVAGLYVLGGVAFIVFSIALVIVQRFRRKKWEDVPAFASWFWVIWGLSAVVTVMAMSYMDHCVKDCGY